MKKINIAVIGAGYWGPNLVRNFAAVDNCDVKNVCDLDSGKLEKNQKPISRSKNYTKFSRDSF